MEPVKLQPLYGWRCPECGTHNAIEPIRDDAGQLMPPMSGDEYTCCACGVPVKLGDVSVADAL